VRFIVPYPPGGITDLLARRLGESLSQAWGQPVVIENRAGAGGNIAAATAARAAPDGHTIFMGFLGTHAANASLYRDLGYDPVRDFTPVGLVAAAPMVLTVHPSVPASTLAEFIAHARANPGKLSFGSSGNGGASHLALELFKSLAGVDILHVPYRGTAPLATDLLAGRISGYFDVPITAGPNIEAGKVRALAVGFERRSSRLPDVPTFAEAGMPAYSFSTWLGVLAPAGLPAPVLARMSQDLLAVVRSPEFIEWCKGRGLETMPSTPEEFSRFMAAETEKFARLIRTAGIRLE
jgi:tripartite-type tricarboxylate transporter receptor subunit TctC